MPAFDLSLVLACYNEEPIIKDRIEKIFEVLDSLNLASEVIFVDDASEDETERFIDLILHQNPKRDLRKIVHEKNVGRGGSVSDGIRAAHGHFVGFIDLDLEIDPTYIKAFLLALEQGYDVATARRIYKFQPRWLHRQIMSKAHSALVKWYAAVPLMDTQSGFKFFRREKIFAYSQAGA